MVIAFYVFLIAAANIVTAATTPIDMGFLGLVTWGTFFAGGTFLARDAVQMRYGRAVAYVAIYAGILIGLFVSLIADDPAAIAVASMVAFTVSESLDTEIFTRLHRGLPARVAVSGIFGSILDSAIFVVLGLSPLWSGFIPWSAVPKAIFGQVVIKCAMQVVAAAVLVVWRRRRQEALA